MTSSKYIGMDVHKESTSIAVMNAAGKMVMECVIETKASMILQKGVHFAGSATIWRCSRAIADQVSVGMLKNISATWGSNSCPASRLIVSRPVSNGDARR
jgi:hypothetical protein